MGENCACEAFTTCSSITPAEQRRLRLQKVQLEKELRYGFMFRGCLSVVSFLVVCILLITHAAEMGRIRRSLHGMHKTSKIVRLRHKADLCQLSMDGYPTAGFNAKIECVDGDGDGGDTADGSVALSENELTDLIEDGGENGSATLDLSGVNFDDGGEMANISSVFPLNSSVIKSHISPA